MFQIKSIFFSWLPIAIVCVSLPIFVHLAVQQDYRLTVNDPQIQLAEDGAAGLVSGRPAQAIIPSTMIDASKSLAPFMIVYGRDGRVIASSGQLHNQTPVLPDGVLDQARQKGELRFTWQPESGVRLATVIVYNQANNPGYVLAARSLREVEQREHNLALITIATIAGLLFATLASHFIPSLFSHR